MSRADATDPTDAATPVPPARPSRRRLLFLLPVVVFAGAAVFLAIGLTRDPSMVPSPLIDQPAPAFSLPPLPGRDDHGFSSKDLGGKLMIVNFFASWCVPCRLEAPLIERLAKEQGITVQGIAYKDPVANVTAWLDQLGDPFTRIGLDSNGRTAIDWGVYGVPESFIIDARGRIVYKQVGPFLPQDFDDKILPLLAKLEG
jgi:cytochrome c biogenesis protein CcmG/thiol:disulfide interchange protein DsbE